MAAAEIQVVNPANLLKIESFFNDSAYKEVIESSSSFNSRLCADRRMRMPFLDPQTGVAQNHCNLFMSKRQRMPGAREGQVYTYPSHRWRKARRQYLSWQSTRWGWSRGVEPAVVEGSNDDSSGLPGDAGGDDSRDGSQTHLPKDKDESKQDWFYDDLAMDEIAELEEPEQESDEDYYDDTYANRRKRRGGGAATTAGTTGVRGAGRRPKGVVVEETTPKRGRGGRGRKRGNQGMLPYEVAGDADKPYGCELCGARYKTRPGLTYHYTHTHKEPKEGVSDGDSRDSARASASDTPATPTATTTTTATTSASAAATAASEYQDSYVTFLNNPAAAAAAASASARRPTPPPRPASADTSSSDSTPAPPPVSVPPSSASATAAPAVPPAAAPTATPAAAETPAAAPAAGTNAPAAASVSPASAVAESKIEGEIKASPSPYCDFCLGDDRENKKTGIPEQLVSCSDCGRSGKPLPNGVALNRRLRNGYTKDKDNHASDRPTHTLRHSTNSYSAEDFDSFVSKNIETNSVIMERDESSPSPPTYKTTQNKAPVKSQNKAPVKSSPAQEKRSPGRPRKHKRGDSNS